MIMSSKRSNGSARRRRKGAESPPSSFSVGNIAEEQSLPSSSSSLFSNSSSPSSAISNHSNGKGNKKKGLNRVLLDWSHTTPSFLSYISIGLGLGWFFTIPLLIFITPIVYKRVPFVIYFTVGCILLSTVYPVNYKFQPNICYGLGEWMIKTSMRYFAFKVECEDYEALDRIKNKKQPFLFAMEPHGVLPVTLFWGKTDAMKNLKYRCCLSSSIFAFPMMKHFLTWCGAVSVDKAEMNRFLDMGFSLGLCPGGVKEVQYLGDDSECVMYLKEHKGFTKLALSRGLPIVPTITFGLRNTYSIWKPPQYEWLKALGSKMGFFPMVFFGLWKIPFAQAKPAPLTLILGKPIELPQIDNETIDNETLNRYHNVVISEIARVFEDNKEANGYGDVRLRIV